MLAQQSATMPHHHARLGPEVPEEEEDNRGGFSSEGESDDESYRYGPHEVRIRSAWEASAEDKSGGKRERAGASTGLEEAPAVARAIMKAAAGEIPASRDPSTESRQRGFVVRRSDTLNHPVSKQAIIDRLEAEHRRGSAAARDRSGHPLPNPEVPASPGIQDDLQAALKQALAYEEGYNRKLLAEEETRRRLGVEGLTSQQTSQQQQRRASPPRGPYLDTLRDPANRTQQVQQESRGKDKERPRRRVSPSRSLGQEAVARHGTPPKTKTHQNGNPALAARKKASPPPRRPSPNSQRRGTAGTSGPPASESHVRHQMKLFREYANKKPPSAGATFAQIEAAGTTMELGELAMLFRDLGLTPGLFPPSRLKKIFNAAQEDDERGALSFPEWKRCMKLALEAVQHQDLTPQEASCLASLASGDGAGDPLLRGEKD